MLSGNEPTGGYMVAKGTDLGDIVSADDFYDETKISGILSNYFKKNKSELSGSDNYLGIWHNTEDGQVYLDVSQNILDRTEAIVAGQTRDQISIWDVVNFEEIGTGGTGDIRTNRHSEDSRHFRNDGSGDRSTINADSKTDLSRKREAAERIIRHLPGKHNQKSHGGGRGGGISKLTAGKAAQQVYEKATRLEPQITKQVQDLATANGAELVGLKDRLKTVESLERKIGDKARDEFGGDNKAAAADIGDSVRYTMKLDEQNYSSGVRNTIDVLNQEGYKTNVKNYWQENNIYKGVNVTVSSPEGQKFELQFHTPGSYGLKQTKNNDLYQVHRLSTTSSVVKYDLEQQMANNWLDVQTPPNLDLLATISRPVLQPPSQRLD